MLNQKILSTLAIMAIAPFLALAQDANPAQTDSPESAPAQAEETSVPATGDVSAEGQEGEAAPAEAATEQQPAAPDNNAAPAEAPAATEAAVAPAPEEKPQAAPEVPELPMKKSDARELRMLQLKKTKLEAEVALEQSKAREGLAEEAERKARLDADNALLQARTALKFAEIDERKGVLDATAARDAARDQLTLLERNSKISESELDSKIAKLTQEIELAKLNVELSRVKLQEEERGLATDEQKYLKDPVVNGTLYISDRRIDFNGPVTDALASYVSEQISLYNNQSTEFPIFIVIDSSPGGSAFAGYQILKSIESSKAPVCVVVKSYAASMAAIITTCAPKSYCYENTIILHHQASSGATGNMTVIGEQYEQIKNWTDRLFEPVLKKIGKTREEFVKEMYANFSTGDWQSFGVDAQKMNWVDEVVDRIVETNVVKRGKVKKEDFGIAFQKDWTEKVDSRGNAYVELPTLKSGDVWLLFDPQNRYREAR
ncbi:MAG: ATP-dependent Clp protease proteolytic subunit [Opitutae bacterium]|nr:ATP-dependent Clp protease proteolytic subunit [Opitutae bacterium]MCD8299232.1 ATP-dependent Clp protease proteolytic subunit [Opitutae bacterium]